LSSKRLLRQPQKATAATSPNPEQYLFRAAGKSLYYSSQAKRRVLNSKPKTATGSVCAGA